MPEPSVLLTCPRVLCVWAPVRRASVEAADKFCTAPNGRRGVRIRRGGRSGDAQEDAAHMGRALLGALFDPQDNLGLQYLAA